MSTISERINSNQANLRSLESDVHLMTSELKKVY